MIPKFLILRNLERKRPDMFIDESKLGKPLPYLLDMFF